jgi:hypothetical protein
MLGRQLAPFRLDAEESTTPLLLPCLPLEHPRSYGLHLFLLSIDEGISGYRDDSLDTVKRNEAQYQVRYYKHHSKLYWHGHVCGQCGLSVCVSYKGP